MKLRPAEPLPKEERKASVRILTGPRVNTLFTTEDGETILTYNATNDSAIILLTTKRLVELCLK